ncbi:hypothetical protein JCM10908_001105 [Rhodotorula pacifica]|uniref:putative asparagine synthase n=1 Tax=Rhodotorula pacifica TaxID=1495444 RepID=UPI003174BBF2
MCGIAFTVRAVSSDSGDSKQAASAEWERLTDAVRSRGPDASNAVSRRIRTDDGQELELRFFGSVLHMRGDAVTPQPLVSPAGDVLLWNGEIFDGLEVGEHENDGLKLIEKIQHLGPERILEAIGPVEGPYAFVYFQAAQKRLYYGRDPLGRRSLLACPLDDGGEGAFALASNAPPAEDSKRPWEEVTCDAVHSHSFASWLSQRESFPRRHPSAASPDNPLVSCLVFLFARSMLKIIPQVYPFDRINPSLPKLGDTVPMTRMMPPGPVIGQRIVDVVDAFILELERAVRARVATVPPVPAPPAARIAVLFSGGLDCTVIAAILHRVLPPSEAIDLITVAFENPRSLAAREQTLQHPPKGSSRRGIRGPKRKTETPPAPPPNAIPLQMQPAEEDATTPLSPYDVPDRLTARDAWRELRELYPQRHWNLVEVDVPYAEMLEHRQHVIDLMKPQNTVMDLSIALAFYFAARGRGHLRSTSETEEMDDPDFEPYTSHARVLLSGLGADELLGGYARHRRAFNQPKVRIEADTPEAHPPSFVSPGQPSGSPANENWQALITELQMDLDRLPTRNLGRDDRIMSTHGKEARYPFLAGHVVDFLARQPVWYKADMRFIEGVGDKMLLRALARHLGLHEAARRKKRAIHFGARTAKMNLGDGGAKGTDLL